MAAEARRQRGELAAWQMSEIVARIPFAGPPPDPQAVNPYRPPPTAAAARLMRWQKSRRWRAFVDAHRPKTEG